MKVQLIQNFSGTPRKWRITGIDDESIEQYAYACSHGLSMKIVGIDGAVIVERLERSVVANNAIVVERTSIENLNNTHIPQGFTETLTGADGSSIEVERKSQPVTNIAMIKNDNKLWNPEQMCAQALSENPNCKSALLIMIDKTDSSFFVHYAANLSKEEKIAFMEYQKAMFMRDIV